MARPIDLKYCMQEVKEGNSKSAPLEASCSLLSKDVVLRIIGIFVRDPPSANALRSLFNKSKNSASERSLVG